MIKVVVADCSPLYRQGIEAVLAKLHLATQFLPVSSYEELIDEIDLQQGSVTAIIDYRLPGLFDIGALKAIIETHDLNVIMLTDRVDTAFTRWVISNGIKGVLSKTARIEELETLIAAVLGNQELCSVDLESDTDLVCNEPWVDPEAVLCSGLSRLSKQESIVLYLVRTGMRNKQIASEMCLTVHTIKSHISNILRKLRIENRTRLVVLTQNITIEDYLSVPIDSAQYSGPALAVV